MPDPLSEDLLSYLEMARIAMASIPDDLVDQMDMSDEEFHRLRDALQKRLYCDKIPERVEEAAESQHVDDAATPQAMVYFMIQQGGSSAEWYPKCFDTRGDADEHRLDCGNNGCYHTTPVLEIPMSLADHPAFIDAVDAILDSLEELDLIESPGKDE